MEDLQYPGFSPEQIEYLSLMFPAPIVVPDKSHDKIMHEAGQHSVVDHIKAQEQFK